MPKAVVSLEPTHFDLDSLEGGWVRLKPMSFGQKQHRSELATDQSMKEFGGDQELFMRIMNRRVSEYEFRTCIVDHNLDDENDNKLDFKNPATLDILDPRVGDEIDQLITKMNTFNSEEAKN